VGDMPTCGLIAVPGVLAAMMLLAGRRRVAKPGHCRSCGYNLQGNTSGICPECGQEIPPPPCRTVEIRCD
ncbi:MAG: hypothetical protein ACYS7M_10475, partial [Planctomycetota bacterium]